MIRNKKQILDELEQIVVADTDSLPLLERVTAHPAQLSFSMNNYCASVNVQGYWVSEATAIAITKALRRTK